MKILCRLNLQILIDVSLGILVSLALSHESFASLRKSHSAHLNES